MITVTANINTGPKGHNAQLQFFKKGVSKVYLLKIWKKYIRYNILTLQTL